MECGYPTHSLVQLYAETRSPIIWTHKTYCRQVEIPVEGWLPGKKEGAKKSLKIIEIYYCQLCIEDEV